MVASDDTRMHPLSEIAEWDERATGVLADGSLWAPAYHWLVVVNERVFIGGLN